MRNEQFHCDGRVEACGTGTGQLPSHRPEPGIIGNLPPLLRRAPKCKVPRAMCQTRGIGAVFDEAKALECVGIGITLGVALHAVMVHSDPIALRNVSAIFEGEVRVDATADAHCLSVKNC